MWVWNASTGQLQRTYSGHTDWVISLACSPDGKYIASGSFDRTVQVWEAYTGRQVVIYGRHSDKICSVAWSPDGQRIASGDAGGTVNVWPVTLFEGNGQQQKPYVQDTIANDNQHNAVAWSPNGRYIASGGMEGSVQVWNARL